MLSYSSKRACSCITRHSFALCLLLAMVSTAAMSASQASPCFPLSQIILEGEGAEYFQEALYAVTKGSNAAIGKCVSIKDIQDIAAQVQNFIIEKGWVTTRVLLPMQDLRSKQLRLKLVSGTIQDVQLVNQKATPLTHWRVLPLQAGKMLNLRDMEQTLENLKHAPSVKANITIEPAAPPHAKVGESMVNIHTPAAYPLRMTLFADDAGSNTTGKYQGGVTVAYDNLLKLNDVFYITFNHPLRGKSHPQGSNKGYAGHYSLAVDYWKFTANSRLSDYYQMVPGVNQIYEYAGNTQHYEAELDRILYRDGVRKAGVFGGVFLDKGKQFIEGIFIELQNRRTAGWKAGIHYKAFMGNRVLDINVACRRGTGAFGARSAPQEFMGGGTSRFKMITADGTFITPFASEWRYIATVRLQQHGTLLTPQESFSIGNRQTVRGFDEKMSLLAESGGFLRNEWIRDNLYAGQAGYLGIDYGRVAGPSSKLLNGNWIAGAVVGLRGGKGNFNYEFFIGTPLKKPSNLKTNHVVAGFSVHYQILGKGASPDA